MNEAMLNILVLGVLTLAMIGAGVYQLVIGYRSYRTKSDLGHDKSSLHFGKLKVSSNSVGAFIMGTAAVWGVCAVLIRPTFHKEGDNIQVSSQPVDVQFNSPVLATSLSAETQKVLENPEQLRRLFTNAVVNRTGEGTAVGTVTLNNQPAHFDLKSVRTKLSHSGKYLISAEVSTGALKATVAYAPTNNEGRIEFIAAGVTAKKSEPKHGP